ncbi:hypothetical protein E4U42_007187 [Claviceps africana]|uniref:Secreted protein n=1 Tax=Claviceps africana TaxID=83212 RepID=A0A8K0NG99_9HYPO|nr:hypothetical protein E4U42_007187 [Claviceps africana]
MRFTTTTLVAVALLARQLLAGQVPDPGCNRGPLPNQDAVTKPCDDDGRGGWTCGPFGANLTPARGSNGGFYLHSGPYEITAAVRCLDGRRDKMTLYCTPEQTAQLVVVCPSGKFAAEYYLKPPPH